MVERCPCCQQRIKLAVDRAAVRVCFDCKKLIAQHHKWTMQERDGVLTCVHRLCDHPTMYVTPAEYRRRHGDSTADRMGIPNG